VKLTTSARNFRTIIGDVLIRSQEVGVLPSAPGFREGGIWPPVATDWVPLRWELFDAAASDREAITAYGLFARPEINLTEDALSSDSLYERALDPVEMQHAWAGDKELRRLLHAARWEREDPVIQLPPGSTHEMMHSVTTGLSIEHSQTLASSLGISVGSNLAGLQTKLNSELKQEFGLKLDITVQEERSTKLTLANNSDDHYRLFALWHVYHRLTVDALVVPLHQLTVDADGVPLYKGFPQELPRGRGITISPGGLRPAWVPRGAVEFVTSNEPFITYTQINHS